MSPQQIFIVSPVYNEARNVESLVAAIKEATADLPYAFTVLLVDDGSGPETAGILEDIASAERRVRVLRLSRNFGHQAALTAGMKEACDAGADAVICMDSDLQHPPRLIPELVRQWELGYEVVYTVRDDSVRTGLFKRVTASLFYRFVDAISERPVPRGAADFRLLARGPLVSLCDLPERARFLRGLTSWIGFKQIGIHYVPDPRLSGESKYTLSRMFKLAADGIVSMTTLPLRIILFVGLFVSFASMAYLAYVVVAHFMTNRTVPGWSSVIVSVLALGGMTLTVLGVMGLYLAKIYEEVKGRPLYIVHSRFGQGPGEGDPR